MEKLLTIKGLNVSIDTAAGELNAVRNVSFSVSRGETLAIVGESGCGKSLTVLALMDLLTKNAHFNAETIRFNGIDLNQISRSKMSDIRGNRMAMIFQEPMTSLNPCYTIGNQLEESLLRHKKVTRSQAREKAISLMEKVGITPGASRIGQYPHQLSGGLRQRIMIAMALMCNPGLIIADEPTTALDVTIQIQILALLKSLQKEFNMGMILITHDLGVVSRMADKIAIMYCGEFVETGSGKDIFYNPLHPYTKGLLECVPVPGSKKRLGSIPGIVPTPIGLIKGCTFRTRCSQAIKKCAEETTTLVEISQHRQVRCNLNGLG